MEKMIIRDDNDDGDHVTMIGSPPSSEGKMVIKLKIPSSTTTVEDGKRVCLECKKEFSSGKALGGHMRVHVQSARKIKNPNFLQPSELNNGDTGKPYYKPYYMNSVNDEGKPTCSQCGKTFPSMKSLFGHMRCHPERVWRGILPPPDTNTPAAVAAVARRRTVSLSETSSSHVDDGGGGGDRVVDLMRFLRGWPVTSRRGRRALKAADEDAVLLTAAEDLMTLANGNGNGGGDMIRNFSDNESDSRINYINEKLLVDYKYKIKRRKKMKFMMELGQNNAVVGGGAGATPVAVVREQQLQRVSECKYKCNSCEKCFATHQALGGHRSSHNKSKVKSSDYDRIEEDDYERCLMNQSGNNSSQITSTGEAGSDQSRSGQKVFEFDLNEIPGSMMEEDANGYASSSYNSNMS